MVDLQQQHIRPPVKPSPEAEGWGGNGVGLTSATAGRGPATTRAAKPSLPSAWRKAAYRSLKAKCRAAILSLCLCSPAGVFGQERGALTFCLRDSVTQEPVNGAVLELLNLHDSTRYHTTSYLQGNADFRKLAYGDYSVTATFLGYDPARRRIRLDRPVRQPDTLLLHPAATPIEEVVLSVPALRSTQNGDTLSYRANAYKVAFGANTESLITKMPGIAVSDRGIEAHGRDVRKVMIDGEEFFGNDVLSALKNIPADMVDNIEVFNRLSDEAELTGVDDGRGYTAINVVTRPERRRGTFGRLFGSYGVPDKYVGGGNINRFGQKRRLSLIGLANNISLHNFVSEDIVGATEGNARNNPSNFVVKPLPGISSVQSLGANFNNKWFTGSYFFNRTDNSNLSTGDRENLLTEKKRQLTTTKNDFEAENYNHRFSGKMNFTPGRHSFIVRPAQNRQDLSDRREQAINTRNRFGEEDIRFLNNRLTSNRSDRRGFNVSNTLHYRYRFRKKNRSLAFSLFGNYYDNQTDTRNRQYTFRDPQAPLDPEAADSRSAQQSASTTRKVTARGGATYTEPLSKRMRLNMEYSFTYSRDEAGKTVYLLDKASGQLDTEPDARQSSENVGTFLTHKAGPRLSYYRRKTAITAGITYQHMTFSGESIRPTAAETHKSFDNLTYEAVANITVDPQNTIRLDARGRTLNPSMVRLQNVVNLANQSHITAGNPDLAPSYLHEVGIRYIRTAPLRGSTFSLSVNYNGSGNYIGDSLVIAQPDFVVTEGVTLGEGNQFSRPANIGGYHRFWSKATYGFPVQWLKSNLNLHATVALNVLPGIVNGERTPVHRNDYGLGFSLNSNISETLDFRIGYTGQYARREFSTKVGKIGNDYFSQTASGEIKWEFWHGFTFTGSLSYRQEKGITAPFNDRTLLCNLHLGKRLFRNRLGEFSIGINDLFDDNSRRYIHTINASGTNDIVNQGIGRYMAVQFVYHLRAYRK